MKADRFEWLATLEKEAIEAISQGFDYVTDNIHARHLLLACLLARLYLGDEGP